MRTPLRLNHGKITFVLYNKPSPCRGKCIYCFSVNGFTKSTTSNDDTLLAKNSDWNGRLQISERFKMYGLAKDSGIKCDLAVKGDSFGSHSYNYLRKFTKEIYDFLNNSESKNLEDASFEQARGADRCVTYKIETRPDQIDINACLFFAELGVTTVELGVQSLDNSVLEYIKRGHDSETVKKATLLLRKFGFEVCYQIMVGLPGSNPNIDEKLLSEVLWEEDYSPDALKIYPCLLLKKEVAHQERIRQLYKNGKWQPLKIDDYVALLNKCYPRFPRYVHVNRIQRILPSEKIVAGPSSEIDRLQFSSISNCLWQRSVAQKKSDLEIDFQNYNIVYYNQGYKRYCFEANFEETVVLGYSRLDIISNKSAIIRDIRVLGNMLPVGGKNNLKIGCQHIGIGTSMMKAMEQKALEEKLNYIFVKPSFGSVNWFKNQSYKPINNYYLVKALSNNPENCFEIIDELKQISEIK